MYCLSETLPNNHQTVATHKADGTFAQTTRKRLTKIAVSDQQVGIISGNISYLKHRNARYQKPRHMRNRFQCLFDERKRQNRCGVAVDYGPNIRSQFVNLTMNM